MTTTDTNADVTLEPTAFVLHAGPVDVHLTYDPDDRYNPAALDRPDDVPWLWVIRASFDHTSYGGTADTLEDAKAFAADLGVRVANLHRRKAELDAAEQDLSAWLDQRTAAQNAAK